MPVSLLRTIKRGTMTMHPLAMEMMNAKPEFSHALKNMAAVTLIPAKKKPMKYLERLPASIAAIESLGALSLRAKAISILFDMKNGAKHSIVLRYVVVIGSVELSAPSIDAS